ncbi:MAG TPA: hypothetical protein VG167_10475 [Verrucomicrobiae bacterium]|nr:hypothetical protein [Verrucomicrobiae bacterium]
MSPPLRLALVLCLAPAAHVPVACAAPSLAVGPAPQEFLQEIARAFTQADGAPTGRVQLIECLAEGTCRAFAGGAWYEVSNGTWRVNHSLVQAADESFVFPGNQNLRAQVALPWREVRQVMRRGATTWVATAHACFELAGSGPAISLNWPADFELRQLALSPAGKVYAASSGGLRVFEEGHWERVPVLDTGGRAWAVGEVTAAGFDSAGQLWFGSRAGVGCQTAAGWRFYEGKDGLPWNDFTSFAAGPRGEVWFTTHLGVIRFDDSGWHYRQGPGWLPVDDVVQAAVDGGGTAWFATAKGIGWVERRAMTLAAKAEFYEEEIARYVKRTRYGFVAEAALRRRADKTSADPQDSDNDGMWTSMYGAGECFAFAATHDPKAKARARQAFEALRFLQKVTQGCSNAPPKGFVARSIRPVEWPDPNIGQLESDREEHLHDPLWKVYAPRWPRSADGKWFWKSDTSSDELDGHFFFYPLYFDLCADTPAEQERVREVVRDLMDHLLAHDDCLVDHDGTPTRWAVFDPQRLNFAPQWQVERGLNSLSLLTYLAAAAHVTGEAKYTAAARQLIEQHGYGQNACYPKVEDGPGSGNQSDDEMAFLDYYGLYHCSTDAQLKAALRPSFYGYWANEQPEMCPLFNFIYAACVVSSAGITNEPSFPPWPGWLDDSLGTLRGFPLDRLNWACRNSHRLDVVRLPRSQAIDLTDPRGEPARGYVTGGKVLPVENRHFNHWNTDPWQLDYDGNGEELAAGTVFLLPYYMGLYHGFIAKPPQ